jgi:Fic family protein
MPWNPKYRITDPTAAALVEIGRAQGAVESHSWSPLIEERIRFRARVRSTHHSTRIEGNRLTLAEAEAVVRGRRVSFAGRKRDVGEVERYWKALAQVHKWAEDDTPLSENLVRKLHAMVEKGPRSHPSPYRQVQNFVHDSGSGEIVFAPPESHDVPKLMTEMVAWIRDAERKAQPAVPIAAALAHYQLVTIHPFLDGNGRTARLLATLMLHRAGLGLRGFFSLEEYHARDLDQYYQALVTHPNHNYYEGRADADLTPWVEYFTRGVAGVFSMAAEEALRLSAQSPAQEPSEIRSLDPRARRMLTLFAHRTEIRSRDVANLFTISPRAARDAIARWVERGVLEIEDRSNKGRTYGLTAVYRRYIGSLSEADDQAHPSSPSSRKP